MTDPIASALGQFNEDNLKRALADAIRRGDTRTAADIKADLDKLSPSPDKGPRETR